MQTKYVACELQARLHLLEQQRHMFFPQISTVHNLELTEQCPAAKFCLPWVDEVLKIHLNMQ